MKFSSIKEFFYKLQSMCYALLLLPLGIMIVLYVVPRAQSLPFLIEDAEMIFLMQLIFPMLAVIELTTVHLVLRIKFKRISTMPGLGDRLDRYVPLAMMRLITGVLASIVMLIGLFLTSSAWFMGYAVALLIIVFLQRPTPASVSRQLQLKGMEKELILKGELV